METVGAPLGGEKNLSRQKLHQRISNADAADTPMKFINPDHTVPLPGVSDFV
jgi:hypothetical protein